jgi:hypothetical protein
VSEIIPENISADPLNADELSEVAQRAPIHEGDRIPGWLLRVQELLFGWLSRDSRVLIAVVLIAVAVVGLLTLSSMKFFRIALEDLDITAYVGLFLVNWIGNGGVLVPIPGARFVGLLMIFQNAVLFPSLEVFAVSGAAMGLGLLSYYIAGARTERAYRKGDTEGAERLAKDTGMLAQADEPTMDMAQSMTPIAQSPHPKEDHAGAQGQGGGLKRRVSDSFKQAQDRAEPVIEKHGVSGMFLLCFAPTPLGTAAAFLGGLMRFGFSRYLAASFASKYLLAGIIVVAGLAFSGVASTVQLPF